MKTVERAFAVLRALAEHPDSAGVSELARRSGLPKSTTSRLLVSLDELGMVERIGDRYVIGPGLATLTHAPSPVASMTDLSRPYLVELADALDESVSLAIPDGDEIVYIYTAVVEGAVQVQDWTGHRYPCHLVASGLSFMAHWPDHQLRRYCHQELETYTDATVADFDELMQRVSQVRADGVAWTKGDFAEGLVGMAVAIIDGRGRCVGSVGVSGPSFRFPGEATEAEIVQQVAAVAGQISNRLQTGEALGS